MIYAVNYILPVGLTDRKNVDIVYLKESEAILESFGTDWC